MCNLIILNKCKGYVVTVDRNPYVFIRGQTLFCRCSQNIFFESVVNGLFEGRTVYSTLKKPLILEFYNYLIMPGVVLLSFRMKCNAYDLL